MDPVQELQEHLTAWSAQMFHEMPFSEGTMEPPASPGDIFRSSVWILEVLTAPSGTTADLSQAKGPSRGACRGAKSSSVYIMLIVDIFPVLLMFVLIGPPARLSRSVLGQVQEDRRERLRLAPRHASALER